MSRRSTVYCSFCGKPNHEVRFVVAGPNWNFICEVCVLTCVKIVTERHPSYRAEVIAELDADAWQEIQEACRATVGRKDGDIPESRTEEEA